MKILLIEHDARDVRLFKQLLNEAARGYCDITVARRLSSALAKLGGEPFDIVLLELSLPDSQGLDTFLKAHALAPGTPFLVLTRHANEDLAIGVVGRGATDYFIKGQVDGASLVRAMRYAIEHTRSEEMLRRNAAILQMLQEMTVATNEADTLEQAMRFCLERICTFMHWPIGHVYACADGNEDSLICSDIWHLADEKRFKRFRKASEQLKPVPGSGLTAQVLSTGRVAWVRDVQKHPSFRRAKAAKAAALRSAFAFPVLEGKKVVAILEFFSEHTADADDAMLEAIAHLGTQLGRVTERIQAQQALRQSEQRFRDLIEGSVQGILIQRARKPLFANQSYADILGYASPAEILAMKSIDAFFASYERTRVHEYSKIRMAGGQAPTQYEYDAQRKDGSLVTLQNVVRVVHWEGKPAIQSTVIDITERRRAEATLNAVIDAVPAMINAKDERSRYIFMNRYQAELYGVSSETAVGKTAAEILNAGYGAYTEALDRQVLATGKAIPYFEEQYTDAKDLARTFLTTKVPLHGAKGRVTQLATVSLDITERKRAEDDLRKSQQRLAEAQRIAHIGSWERDIAAGTLSWSDEVYRIFGLQPQQCRPNYKIFLNCVHPEDRDRVRSAVAAAVEEQQAYNIDYRIVRPDGEIRVAHVEAEVFVDAAGEPARMVGTVQDITESKRLEQALEVRARQQAVIAELGQLALGGVDLSDLLSESVTRIAGTLSVEYCKVLELLPEGNALVLRAGVGWKRGMVGHATVNARSSDSQAAWTLHAKEPVIVTDLRTETRFHGPPLLQEHGVVSGLSVVIEGRAQPFGVLGVHTRQRRAFVQDDVNFLRAAANVLAEAIERKRAEETLAKRARRFEGLIRTSAKVAGTIETEDTLTGIAKEAANLLGLEGGGFRLLVNDELVVAGRYGLAQQVMHKYALKVGESLTGLVAREGRTIAVPDLRTDDRLHPDHKRLSISQGIVAYLGTPLRYRGKLIGVLNVYGKQRHVFDEEEMALLQAFADHAAIAIEKARLYSKTKRHAEELGNEVAERKQAEAALRESEKRYRALYDDNPSMYFTVDAKGTVLSVNSFGAQQLGYASEELIGTSIFALFKKEDRKKAKQKLNTVVHEPERLHRWESRKLLKDGGLLWVRETMRATKDADGQPVALIVCEDITETRELSEELSYQASHDALTGLVNRWEFEQRLQRLLRSARAAKTEHALCYLDLDQFKVINDTCGHIAGDELLRQLGQLLRGEVRKRDTLARLGGDEFGLLMEHCSLKQALRVANALREAIQDFRYTWEDKSFSIGVSIGVVPITEATTGPTSVLSMADAACYAAKDEGRNRIRVYHEDNAELARRHGEMQWVARINQALERNRFQLAFQPIAPLKADEGHHYELLIRMQDEEGNIVPPGAFLPAAERYNLAARLDRWVIGTAFDWLTSQPQHLERLNLCSINLSGHSLGDEEFLPFVIGKFKEGRIPAHKICFEITETAAIANLSSATHFIKALKELGCSFALDDFGSGLSSFAYLKTLPVDFLKIDGVFVKDIVDDAVNSAIVTSINEMGHAMGKKTIAEFVENEAILNVLREIGVDYAQGYGIGRPQPLAEMLTPVTVANIEVATVTVDGNHPLAG